MIVAADPAAAERYEAQVTAVLGAIDVRPPSALLWFGRRIEAAAARGPAIETARERLVAAVSARLLADFYGHGAPRPLRAAALVALGDGGGFRRALSQANSGRGPWHDGWRVAGDERDDDDLVVVVRADGLRMLAPAEACELRGASARVRVPKELTGHRLGFYIALGDSTPDDRELATLYWNVTANGAVTLVARATYALNRAGLPFVLTLVDDPARYERADAAALSLARSDVATALALLRPLQRALAPHMADGAPAFCKPLARGLAFAEEPRAAASAGPRPDLSSHREQKSGRLRFDQQRCGLLAEAIVSARERGLRAPDQRLAVVREHFEAAGVRLDAPYLQPGSADALSRS